MSGPIVEIDDDTAVLLFLLQISDLEGRWTTLTYWHWPEKRPRRLHSEYASWIHSCKDNRGASKGINFAPWAVGNNEASSRHRMS